MTIGTRFIYLLHAMLILSGFSAQIYPPALTWNGCGYDFNAYLSEDQIRCYDFEYKLVFEDNFDGEDLNKNAWGTAYPWGRSLHSKFSGTGWERQYYDDKNVSVKDGMLSLRTIVDPGMRSPFPPFTGNVFFNYTSGMVFSFVRYRKGKFEVRCKIPQINGLFPAFWLYGPCAQEIDIFEFTNGSKTSDPAEDGGNVIMSYHKAFDCTRDRGQCGFGFTRRVGIDLSKDFHVYSVEWDEFRIIWKVDGVISREVYKLWVVSEPLPAGPMYGYAYPVKSCYELKPSTLYSIFPLFPTLENDMHVIINSAVLMERASEAGALPQEFLVDYVRVYEPVVADSLGPGKDNAPQLFPNPTSGIFSFNSEFANDSVTEFVILNSTGKKIEFESKFENGSYIVDMRGNPPGIYFVRLVTANNVFLLKLIVI